MNLGTETLNPLTRQKKLEEMSIFNSNGNLNRAEHLPPSSGSEDNYTKTVDILHDATGSNILLEVLQH